MISYEPLRRMLKERGISRKELAEMMGVTVNSVSSLIRGNSRTSALVKIGTVLNCGVEDIIEYREDSSENKLLSESAKLNVNWEVLSKKVIGKSLSFSRLSIQAGFSNDLLAKSKKRNGKLRVDTIKAIAAVLNCSPSEFILEDEQ